MYTWIIIGGGIQGMTAAVHFIEQKLCRPEELAVIDPHEEPMNVWSERTGRIHMPYLRSSFVHHLSSDPFALEKSASSREDFYGRYQRPSLSLFNRFSRRTLEALGCTENWVQGRAASLEKQEEGWTVHLEDGRALQSRYVLAAVGANETPYVPPALQGHASHVFAETSPLEQAAPPAAVIGGGITAAHTALHLAGHMPGLVTLVSRNPLRVRAFDADPGWLGPKKMHRFMEYDYENRRRCIHEARHTGTMTRELYFRLLQAERKGLLHRRVEEPVEAVPHGSSTTLIGSKGTHLGQFHSVIACTGFQQRLPASGLLQPLIETYSLPCAACGWPVLSASLMWQEGLFASGALAELEIGPSARNIAGAQRAARRITAYFQKRQAAELQLR
ncbi:FAD/NAD(P)-binding protein [Alkalicoccus chagannorensis]|uniref:FAD/NAD(P)-binding protein n=1 Tax=Alkalicoccus chagannorensis TaxID=427072 RepID=UPI000423D387|nr:FAD/NAD(P)-binding protein [Alkalicoccus chagannorensis]